MVPGAGTPKNTRGGGGPVRMDSWLVANLPRLHPTRRKVLKAVVDLGGGAGFVTSTEVRLEVGISQQLLNRHLRGLEAQGLVDLNNPGPGLPLRTKATPAGLRALGLRGPAVVHPAALHDEQTSPAPEKRPPKAVSAKMRFLDEMFSLLEPFLVGLSRGDFESRVSKALAGGSKEDVVRAVRPHLSGMGRNGLLTVMRHAASRATGKPIKPQTTASEVLEVEREPEKKAVQAEPMARPAVLAHAKRESAPEAVQGQSPAGPAAPVALRTGERVLEARLDESCHGEYRTLPWYERTRLFSNEWDRVRRRTLGLLGTYFESFTPRWKRADWPDFNLGRRQADARGADYHDWVAAQFEHMQSIGVDDVSPGELHGEQAVTAYLQHIGAERRGGVPAAEPPYTKETFDLENPDHVVHAQDQINQVVSLARDVFGGDPRGPERLLAQSVLSGALPRQALELTQNYRERVLARVAQVEESQRMLSSANQTTPIQPSAVSQEETVAKSTPEPAASFMSGPMSKLII